MKVLIIDDDSLIVDLLREKLSLEGFDIYSAHDGLSGLECMINESPDVILLDIMMPGLDGFEVCKKLKQSPSTSSMPVIFISACDTQEDIDRAFALGADDYIVKPFDTLSIGRRIKEVFDRTRKSSG
ncbi:MAG: response regulator [Elusimicrobia bacterium]|nr:response regulator [Elusimicrobiota bacterium]MBD3412363.1 response regulator [Elusimicrobiota bacterium]